MTSRYHNTLYLLLFTTLLVLLPIGCDKPVVESTYTVTFDSSGGSAVPSQTVQEGEKATRPPLGSTRAGYTFAGWYADEAFSQVFDFDNTPIRSNITLYAKWDKATYTVTFDSNGGSLVEPGTVSYGEKIKRPSDPTRFGYTFTGWYKDQAGPQKFDFSVEKITADITLYAKWDKATYTVTFDSNGGIPTLPSQPVKSGENAAKPSTDPTRSGYTFMGWYWNQAGTQKFDFSVEKITADITLYAKWDKATYTVTFDSNGGSLVKSGTVSYGEKIKRPSDPTRSGYTFTGWYWNQAGTQKFTFTAEKITTDITLYAKWDQVVVPTYTVTYESNGGLDVSPKRVSIDSGKTVSRPTPPTRTGYTFTGWYSDQALTQPFNFSAPIRSNITLYAKWDQVVVPTYTVTYESNGGLDVSPKRVSIDSGKTVSRPTPPTRTGYTFTGWYSDQALTQPFNFSTPIRSNITLYAKWDQVVVPTYMVTYESNGGLDVSPKRVSIDSGKTVSRPTPPTRTGYTFMGWYSDQALTQTFDFDTTKITTDITLYAKWDQVVVPTYTVIFESNGGLDVSPKRVSIDSGKTVSRPTPPTRSGYTFMGWYSDQALTQTFNFSTPIRSNITLYAKWDQVVVPTYTVTYESNGGLDVSPKRVSIDSGKTVSRPTPPTRTGYTFTGWYSDQALTQTFDFDTTKITSNITLYAKWDQVVVPTYTVVFESNGGLDVSPKRVSIDSGKTVSRPTPPTRTGYTFMGWYSDQALTQTFNFSTPIRSNITLYAKWDQVVVPTYTVTYESNGGLDVSPKRVSIDSGKTVSRPTPPTRSGYTFMGWYSDQALTQTFDFDTTKITSNITLYAKWDQVVVPTYTVVFESNGGLDVSPKRVSIDSGKTVSRPTPPTRTGYTFTGWYSDQALTQTFDFDTTKITSNITLYAKWDQVVVPTYTVTYESNGGLDVSPKRVSIDSGKTVSRPTTPTRLGYTFMGWYSDQALTQTFDFDTTKITSNITLYAKWDQVVVPTYTVVFESNGGLDVSPKRVSIDSGKTVSRPTTPTRTGYTFMGWYSDQALTQTFDFDTTKITSNITLYAKWDQVVVPTYTVTYESNGGLDVSPKRVSIDSGKTVSRPTPPTRSGYTFMGWYSDQALTQTFDFDTTKITSNITLYAKWDQVVVPTYTVTYESNGGLDVSPKRVSIDSGKTVSRPTPPTRSGYTFMGWYSDQALTQTFDFDTTKIRSNITLYAKWDQVVVPTYTVIFESNGGSLVKTDTVSSGEKVKLPSSPTRTGYTFTGWYSDQGLTQTFDFDTTKIRSNITLYAKWDQVVVPTYTVIFESNGGSLVKTDTVSSGEKVKLPSSPTRSGYTFTGWYSDQALTQTFDFDTTKITSNITLYAKWSEKLTVTFMTNGGSAVQAKVLAVGSKVQAPTPPYKGELDLLAWYADTTLTQPFNFNSPLTSDTTLYAKYGFRVPDDKFRSKLQGLVPAAFTGEVLDIADTAVTGRTSLVVASSNINSLAGIEYFTALTGLNCSFNNLTELDVLKNRALISLSCNSNRLTRLNVFANTNLVTLSCYFNNLTRLNVSRNTRLRRLECDRNKLTALDVSRNTNLTSLSCSFNQLTSLDIRGMSSGADLFISGGTNGSTPPLTTLRVLEAVKDHDAIKTVKTTRKGAVTITTYAADRATIVCNNYDPTANSGARCIALGNSTFMVTYESNGGSLVKTDTLTSGEKVKLPSSPTRSGYTFKGWYADRLFTQSFDFDTTRIRSNITLYANWARIMFMVTFESNQGSPVKQDTVAYGETVNRPPTPTREDYVFSGWYSDQALTQTFDFDTTRIRANITLYAKWSEKLTVTFMTNGGTAVQAQVVAKGSMLKAPTPKKGKFDLLAWYTDTALTQPFNVNNPLTTDTTLYAKYGFRVPDGNFRSKLQGLVPAAFTGEVLDIADTAVTGRNSLDVSSSNIQSLAGIEYFTAVNELRCFSNKLTALDLSNNTALTTLDCSSNELTALDMSENKALTVLYCSSNKLTALDMSENKALTTLDCSSNKLTALDMSENKALTILACSSNKLTALDMSKNTALTRLTCSSNKLTALDVSKTTALTRLTCSSNKLTALDVSKTTALMALYCSSNKLTALDMSKNTALTTLNCSSNELTVLDLSTNTRLESLECPSNQLTSLDIRGMSIVIFVLVDAGVKGKNPLTSLRVLDTWKDYREVQAVKTNRRNAVTITTYAADRTTIRCNNYDPNLDICLD